MWCCLYHIPGVTCIDELGGPVPIQLTADTVMLYCIPVCKPVIVVLFNVTLH